MLTLADDWIWDSWIADQGDLYHLYFLKAPRSLGDPGLRHTAATIGHATSKDLIEWDYRGDALTPAERDWEDLALWTGSVARGDDGVWRMYYTAINSGGRGVFDQRIGMVESADLESWHRTPGQQPVVVPDPRWYKTLDDGTGASETWRDPFVFRDPDGDGWHMLITAREVGRPHNDDGVLARARSDDMRTWRLGPPISEPHGFGQIEVPQVRLIDDQPILVFTCHPDEQTEARKAADGPYCTWSVLGDSLTGPWDMSRAVPFVDAPFLFAAPLVQQRDGRWAFVGFHNQEPQGIFSFDIVDPIPVKIENGGLVADHSLDP